MDRLLDRIPRQPAPGNRIVSPVSRQIEPAVGVIEHAGVVEIGERRGSLQRIAVGVVAVGRRARRAGEDAPHRADLVGAVVIRLRRRAGPDVRGRDRAAATSLERARSTDI